MHAPVSLLASSFALSAGLTFAACGNAAPRSAERFCGELKAHANEIETPPATADEIPALITLYSKMGEVAPLDVQPDWVNVYSSLKTANTVNPSDPNSVQKVAQTAIAAQHSAQAVADWAKANCAIDLPIANISGGAAVVVTTTTTIPAASTVAAPTSTAPAASSTTVAGPP